jgi:hypothetical protein
VIASPMAPEPCCSADGAPLSTSATPSAVLSGRAMPRVCATACRDWTTPGEDGRGRGTGVTQAGRQAGQQPHHYSAGQVAGQLPAVTPSLPATQLASRPHGRHPSLSAPTPPSLPTSQPASHPTLLPPSHPATQPAAPSQPPTKPASTTHHPCCWPALRWSLRGGQPPPATTAWTGWSAPPAKGGAAVRGTACRAVHYVKQYMEQSNLLNYFI